MTNDLDAKLREILDKEIEMFASEDNFLDAMRRAYALGRETMQKEAAARFATNEPLSIAVASVIRAIPIMPEEKTE